MSFPAANDERRSWYISGYLVGLVRVRNTEAIESVMKNHGSHFKIASQNLKLDCGSILLQSLPGFLFELGFHSQLRNLFTSQISRFNSNKKVRLTKLIYEFGNKLLVAGEHQEAKGYFERRF